MKNNNISISYPKEIINDLQKLGNSVAKYIALEARNLISNEYKYAVDQFYSSYEPLFYKRHYELYNSFSPYYQNPHGYRFHGGVEINTDKMKDVHGTSNEYILNNSLLGFHGQPSLGIYTPPWIYEHVVNYRDTLFSFIDTISDEAIEKAKKEKYSLLKFNI